MSLKMFPGLMQACKSPISPSMEQTHDPLTGALP